MEDASFASLASLASLDVASLFFCEVPLHLSADMLEEENLRGPFVNARNAPSSECES